MLIAHASIDENGRACGGLAGDQTGREVCVRTYYAANWNKYIRANSNYVAEKMARFAEQVAANDKIGYDQYQRNTLRQCARAAGWDGSKISTACETDCSAFMTVCAEAAGINMDSAYSSGNAPVTQNMCQKFERTGAFKSLVYNSSMKEKLRRGDILVRESGHTAIVLTNGTQSGVSSSPAITPFSASDIHAGDVVQFCGGKHYASASAVSGVTATAGPAKVTYIKQGALHPYHVIHADMTSNVYGWVDAVNIRTKTVTQRTHTIVYGDNLWSIAKTYNVSLHDLLLENGLQSTSLILPGQVLRIPT